jgi:uncharacterized protein with ATP-grasp and redox domains
MKTFLECMPCFVEQALRTSRIATRDEKKIKQVLDEVGCMIKDTPMENTPAESGIAIYGKIAEITGVKDPFYEIKRQHIAEAKALLPELTKMLSEADDPLLTAIRLAIAGNVIDLGISKKFNIVNDVKQILHQDFAIFDYDAFQHHLAKAEKVLYLGDNSGESVFDKLLIQELKKPVIYAVRTRPIINDVTMEEARLSGLDEVAELMDSGSPAPGIILRYATPRFLKAFQEADMVISKGQGNYEGLSEEQRSIFFLLKAKCPVIARDMGVREGDIVLKGINL